MKFANTLEFNAVREWSTHYVAYERLKYMIYDIERAQAKAWQERAEGASEPSQLLLDDPVVQATNQAFLDRLHAELARINRFYCDKERDLADGVHKLEQTHALSHARRLELMNRQRSKSLQAVPQPVSSDDTAYSISIEIDSGHGGHRQETPPHSTTTVKPPQESTVTVRRSRRSTIADDRMDIPPLAHCCDTRSTTPQHLQHGTVGSDGFDANDRTPLLLAHADAVAPHLPGPLSVPPASKMLDVGVKASFREQATDLYVNLCNLKEFVVLNYTAFNKILKKYDKVLHTQLRSSFMHSAVEQAYFWQQNSDSAHHAVLNDLIERVVDAYACLICDGNHQRALSQLGHYLREYVVWERNTIWRDMVGKERRITAAGVKIVTEPEKPLLQVTVPFLDLGLRIQKQWLFVALGMTLFLVLLFVPLFENYRQSRCFALLAVASFFWASEAIPLFVTSMMIPFGVIALDILCVPGHSDASAKDKMDYIFGKMFGPVIMLLLGGFTIAAALSKFHIAKSMATFILSRAGTQSNMILLAIILVATFTSMWLSNVAAPVLCFSVIQPILRTLDPGNSFAKSLVMGIALASNIGGLVTPISSPQNAIAMTNLARPVSWLQWLGVTVPLSILADLVCWLVLIVVYRPSYDTPRVQPIRATGERMTWQQLFIILVTLLTIGLWCAESSLKDVLGGSGVIAIVPMVLFFGTGLLNKDDFNNFLWSVIMLAMGGIALGEAVKNTELLHVISKAIQSVLIGNNVWTVLVAFCALVLVAATFVSHTVSALIILPLVKEVGQAIEGGVYTNVLVLGAAFMCSGAMGLPVSGFPNITAVSLEDATGRSYVSTKDFLKVGILMSVVVFSLTVSVGYGIMLGLSV